MFAYEPLPSTTSIRLLELQRSPPGEIKCTLVTADLCNQPTYNALSYTWANPITIYERDVEEPLESLMDFLTASGSGPAIIDMDSLIYNSQHSTVPYEIAEWRVGQRHSITCNGRRLLVGHNLFRALLFFREMLEEHSQDVSTAWVEFDDEIAPNYLWTDAICINHDDIQERSCQVSLMLRIYGGARLVFGWLGEEDVFSELAISMLTNMCSHIVHHQPNRDECLKSHLRVVGLGLERRWLAVFVFLQRWWFRRIWIVQEAALARKMFMVCGPSVFHWHLLDIAIPFLFDDVVNLATNLMNRKAPNSLAPGQMSGAAMFPNTTSAPAQLGFKINPRDTLSFIEGIRSVRSQHGLRISQITSGDTAEDDISI